MEQSFTTTNTANLFNPQGRSNTEFGWQAGGGLEYQMNNGMSVGLEYLYTSLDVSNDLTVRVAQGTAPATNPFVLVNANGTDMRRDSDSLDFHSVRLTLSKRF